MQLTPGSRLGDYEIQTFLGAGAMGEVYKAQDSRSKRSVAIKVLHRDLADSEGFRKRFERESRILAGLSHPNICAFQELGKENGFDYLVMEYVDGETLSKIMSSGRMPFGQVVHYGQQIADALDAAHRLGLTHRDLKPANILITRAGVKILDFGLAKQNPIGNAEAEDESEESTIAEPLTETGMVVGTFPYMAPEQLEGKAVDMRADVFSFGAVLYEMATGKRAFAAQSKAGLIASVMTVTPPPPSKVEPSIPAIFDWVVDGCLKKNPGDRWQNIQDVRRALELPQLDWEQSAPAAKRRLPGWWIYAACALGMVASTALFLAVRFSSVGQAKETLRFQIPAPANHTFLAMSSHGAAKISPDGTKIVFTARGIGSPQQLWIRNMDSAVARPLEGTRGATYPFWSPDSKTIAFFDNDKLKSIPAQGGASSLICQTSVGHDGAWSENGDILFSVMSGALQHINIAKGGAPETVGPPGKKRREARQFAPQFLPGGRKYIYSVIADTAAESGIYVSSLDKPEERKKLLEVHSPAAFYRPRTSSDGFLLYIEAEKLLAVRFDPASHTLKGNSILIEPQVSFYSFHGRADFSMSDTGVLVYRTGKALGTRELAWFDRAGTKLETIAPGMYRYPALSRDEKSIAVELVDNAIPLGDLWLFDLPGRGKKRFTFDWAGETAPVWTPGNDKVVYSQFGDLYAKSVESGAAPQLLYSSEFSKSPLSISGDGKYLLYKVTHPMRGGDIWYLPLEGDGKPIPFLTTQDNEREAEVSPDGKWVAYTTVKDGIPQVYIESFSPEGTERQKLQISNSSALFPRWRADSRELFFASKGFINSVMIAPGDKLKASSPELLFPSTEIFHAGFGFTPSGDGKRFLFSAGVGPQTPVPSPIHVVFHHPALSIQ